MAPRISLRERYTSAESRMRGLLAEDESFLAQDMDDVLESGDVALRETAEDQRLSLLGAIEELAAIARAELKELRIVPLRLANAARPAGRLPSETLVYIFELVLFANTDATAAPDTLYGENLRLARRRTLSVCFMWHTVATSTTSFWNKIAVTDTAQKPKPLARTKTAVRRAGDRPLEVYLKMDSWDGNRPMVSRMLSKCRVLKLELRGYIDNFGLLETGTAMPYLHTLTLSWRTEWRGEKFDKVDLLFGSSLRSVTIHTMNVDAIIHPDTPMCRLRLPRKCDIVRLSIVGTLEPYDAAVAINSCPHLETLRWHHNARFSDAIRDRLPAVQCSPSLLHLSINATTSPMFRDTELAGLNRLETDGAALQFFQVPDLRFLHVLASRLDPELMEVIVPTFLASHRVLESVAIEDDRAVLPFVGALSAGPLVFTNLQHLWIRGRADPARLLLRAWDQPRAASMPFILHLGGYLPGVVDAEVAVLQLTYADGGHAVLKAENYEDSFWGGPYIHGQTELGYRLLG